MGTSKLRPGLFLLAILLLPWAARAADTVCDARNQWYPNPTLNACRDQRRTGGSYSLVSFSPDLPENPPEVLLHCTEQAPFQGCLPGDPGCSEDPYEYDKIAWARQQCRVSNAARKTDLWTCVDEGITFKTNDVTNACPKNAVNIHRRTDSSPCELLNGNELVDIGNSEFYTCEAIGPGPANIAAFNAYPGVPPGCCQLGAPNLVQEHWELKKDQQMKMNFGKRLRFYRTWPENYLEERSPAFLTACNHPDTPADVTVAHHSCLMTPKDIMIEGFSNPTANTNHQGPGWCDVTTGSAFAGNTLPQIVKDLAIVAGHIAGPKGILTPLDPENYNTFNGDFACFTHGRNYAENCSNLGDTVTDHLGFAHSMGGIVTASWNIPFQQFGGSVVGPAQIGSFRNNCDPIPWVVQIGHRAALAFYATQPVAGGAPGPDGRIPHTYKICAELVEAGVTPTNCMNLDGTYAGRPEGPSNCHRADVPCKWVPWCGANPYQTPPRDYSGRKDFQPMECEGSVTEGLTQQAKECFDLGGGIASDILDCVKAVFAGATFAAKHLQDHLFDGSGNGDGYRPITGANWGEPRRRVYDRHLVCPDGWVPGESANQSRCCTVGLPDGAACGSDGDCCGGLTCNAGRCESAPDCDNTGGTGGVGTQCAPAP